MFPGYGERVFAHWFTDTVRLPQGKQLKYVHMGYGSTYERDLLLRFSRGELIERSVRKNGTGEPDAQEGYGTAALTTLGNRSGEICHDALLAMVSCNWAGPGSAHGRRSSEGDMGQSFREGQASRARPSAPVLRHGRARNDAPLAAFRSLHHL